MARGPNPSGQVQASQGLPAGTKFYSPWPFSGMNTLGSSIAIDDKEFPYIENFVRLGDGKLRTAWDVGSALYNAPAGITIISFFAYSIALNYYFAVFLSDGSAVQVHYPTGAVTRIGAAGTFFKPGGPIPACVQWGVLYLLISNNNTDNDYWAWDGSLLYTAGTAAPNGVTLTSGGEDYTTQPVMTVFGGQGSGIQLKALFNAGNITEVQIIRPGTGYQVGDLPQIQFAGGGSDRGPIITAALVAGGVAGVNITANGSGYTNPLVSFSGGGGTGAAATATPSTGVASVAVTAGGANYTIASVSFSGGGGSGANAQALIVGGQVVEIDMITNGTGYTGTPTVTITGDGTGATATATIQNGGIFTITMTNNGTGYTSAPTVTIADSGGGTGTGATGTAVLAGSNVDHLTVVDAGTGFIYNPLLTLSGGQGAGATGYTTLVSTSLARVDVTASGQLYQKPPSVGLAGGPVGSGQATVFPIMNGAGGVGQVTVGNHSSGYGAPPGVFFLTQKNDTGSGAAARAILAPTPISQALVSNHGLNYTNAPTVIVQPGANRAAYATIELMPFGLSGLALETFLSRVWIANPAQNPFATIPPQGDFSVTAPGSITDVATSDGGVIFTNSDRFLQTKYVAIRQSNGYLYFLGDGSVSVVSSVQTSGNPVQTTFNYQTVDPTVGCSWRDSVTDFGKTVLFGNETGVYGIYGGSASKLSAKLDDLFVNAHFPPTAGAVTPSAAVAHLFKVKHHLMLMTILDPDLGTPRNVMAAWNEKEWVLLSQSPNLTYIGGQKRGSTYYAWGTDGQALYPLFAQPSTKLTKRLDTKAYGAPQAYMVKQLDALYVQASDMSAGAQGIDLNLSFEVSGIQPQSADPIDARVPAGIFSVPAQIVWNSPTPYFNGYGQPSGGRGQPAAGPFFVSASARFSTTSPDVVIGNLLISYREHTANR